VETRAIHVLVAVLRDHDRLVVDAADSAGVDVAADAVVEAQANSTLQRYPLAGWAWAVEASPATESATR
jgi:hypothetical protein